MIKPSIPKGTRDFDPETVRKRDYILNTIRSVFELYGFQPLQTPAMEKLSTLTGKYGEEGDQLMFRILNNGDIYSKAIKAKDNKSLASGISKRALRYDLTIPFARYVVMHQNDIHFPFKRYQIQPVWRADRPQKGRYREFLQCDADVVGSDSLFNEIELLAIYDTVFYRLGMERYSLNINNRKLLAGLAKLIGKSEQLTDITVAIDKLDKIGKEGVRKELQERNIDEESIRVIEHYLSVSGSNEEKIEQLKSIFSNSATGQKGIEELEFVLKSGLYPFQTPPVLNPTLARGLNYYTGTIIEVKAPETIRIGSLGGGGRYDDLTGLFGMKGMSGVGISFGVDRIYDTLEELDLFPRASLQSTQVLFLQMEEESIPAIFILLNQLRNKGISTEVYPDPAKFGKQMKYANQRGIPFVAILGEKERNAGKVSIKNMESGHQESVSQEQAAAYLKERIADAH